MNRYSFDKSEHCHKLDLSPLIGTSTAVGVIGKGGLTYWASGQACEVLGWKNPKKHTPEECKEAAQLAYVGIVNGTPKEFHALLNKAYKAHATKLKDSAGDGIDMHALLEDFVKCRIAGQEPMFIDPIIKPFVEWSDKNVKRFLFSELHCYSETLWTGGITDVGYEALNGDYVLGDFKSSKEAYFSQWVQVGGYHAQIEENGGFTHNGDKVFALNGKPFKYHAIFAAGAGLDKPFFNYEIGRTKRAFTHAVELYKERLFWEKQDD